VPVPQSPQALVPGDREQPRAEPAGVAQPGQARGRDDEGVLDRVGGVGRLAKQRAAVGVQGRGVPVVSLGEPG
jgi:hypothetical protein